MHIEDRRVVGAALVASSIVAGASYVLGAALILFPFHVMPVLLVAWTAGRGPALLLALAAATVAAAATAGGLVDQLTIGLLGFGSLLLCIVSVHRARAAYDREHYFASHDLLTGALNRRAFYDRLDAVGANAARTKQTHLLLYVDLDGFKGVNDRYGHEAGDEVLKGLALAVKAELAPGELFARVGGDEFVALVTEHTDLDPYTQAQDEHERLTAALDGLGFEGLGCSMGAVVISPPVSASREALLKWADELMYEVKRAGKGALRIGHAEMLALAA